MATPTSHPRPSPQKQAQSHLTPASAASPPAAPSSAHSARTIQSPAQQSKKSAIQQQQQYRGTSNGTNGTFQYPSPGPGGTPMSRSGTNNTAIGAGFSGSTPMARTATNGSVAMARTGTNNSSIAGRTPVTMRAGRATSAGSAATTTVGADSPAITAAAAMLMEGIHANNFAAHGGGIIAKGMTPQDGTGLGLGLTPLGGAVSAAGGSIISGLAGMPERDQEEERKRRLGAISTILARRWGWVGQEGVERCAKRIGFECLWEDAMGGEGRRTLSIAGEGVLIEVGFLGDGVADVGLSFPASQEDVGKWAERGARVLKKDLLGENNGKHKGYVGLELFGNNVQRLRLMDQLSSEGLGCFDAVNGIFKSLERVYERELRLAKTSESRDASVEVMCTQGGKPEMHVNGYVGLMLQYWKERRRAGLNEVPPEASITGKPRIESWSILIECEPCSADLYTPIRLSDQWVSTNIERSPNQQVDEKHISSSNIDWLDVPTKMVGNEENSESKARDVRFVARFEPSIIVPLQLALQICDSVSWPIDQSTVIPTTYESLIFAETDTPSAISRGPRTVDHQIDDDDTTGSRPLRNTLFTQQADFAQILNDIPFKHPMQLVNLLPPLRQWALVSSMLLRAFNPQLSSNTTSTKSKTSSSKQRGNIEPEFKDSPPPFQTLEEEFASFLSSPAQPINTTINGTMTTLSKQTPESQDTFNINVAFVTASPPSSLPHFQIQFPNPKYNGSLATVAFSVGLNGSIEAVEADDGRPPPGAADLATNPGGTAHGESTEAAMSEEASRSIEKLRAQVKRVIEVSEDINVLVRWLSR